MSNLEHNVKSADDFVVIQLYTARGQIGHPPIETDYGPEITLTGYAATAVRLLVDAGNHPVHVSEMRPDAPARLRQAGIPVRAVDRPDFGTGRAAVWMKIDGLCARIVREAKMKDAA